MFRAAALLLVSGLASAAPDYQPLLDQALNCENKACYLNIKRQIDSLAINDGKTKKQLSDAWSNSKIFTTPPKTEKEALGYCGADRGSPAGYYCAITDYVSQISQ